ncbi:MAG: hypothetical protein CMK92_06420 [Pseudomonas sp.]|nr:hypothetical protein [Pseudomonas sp.]|tara:strand:+ start:167 stop:613 length:447 start_codon:yes stop_codon:yes gene_type:complete
MRKRKKYNKFKSAGITAKAGLKNLAVVCKTLGNDNGWFYINTKTGNTISRGKSLDFAVGKLRHKWSIITAVTATESKGTECVIMDEVKFEHELYNHEVTSYVQDNLKKLYRKAKGKIVNNTLWIAIPNGDQLEDDQINFLLDKIGAWE